MLVISEGRDIAGRRIQADVRDDLLNQDPDLSSLCKQL